MAGEGFLQGLLGDGVGSVITGRAVEPTAGEHDAAKDHGGDHPAACLNCGAALVGSHCHACGQPAHVHRTIGAFFHDLAHGVFHFEGKIWRTLPMLVLHPGRLTREYADGRRASYVSPIALFLFCVFLMFAAINAFGGKFGENSLVNVNGNSIRGLEANEKELVRLKQERAKLEAENKRTDGLDGQIIGRESAIEGIRSMQDPAAAVKITVPDQEQYSFIPAIDHAIHSFKENPALALYKLRSNAYKYAWALIPLSVPMVWLLFPFSRRFGLYDHTVFVTYSLCFMMLLVAILSVLNGLHVPTMTAAAGLLPPWHLYRQTREAYGLTRGGAIWRTGALMMMALFALTLFMMLILAESGT
ncbi:DUF3667 domain-containing protein [Novosphingobium sp.]|uniref:DUF3667 domain-containing protein n=1 Tax=Novosphingobium sp. TaxID=1874826 RepID=UPI0025F4E075|nr:DUF3667 domain-containing protein [Novosphingobium sp.]